MIQSTTFWSFSGFRFESLIDSFDNNQPKCILDGDCAQGEECCDDVCMPWILCQEAKSKNDQ